MDDDRDEFGEPRDDYYDDETPVPEAKRLARMAAVFRGLSDPLRLQIYEVFWKISRAGVTIGELVERTGAKQSLVSFHVKKLVEAELLTPDRPGHRKSGYHIHGTAFADVRRWQDTLFAYRLPPRPPDPDDDGGESSDG